MSTYHRRVRAAGLIVGTIAAAWYSSCGLVDLRPVLVTARPGTAYAVLDTRYTELSVCFSAEPVRADAERAFSVTAEGAVVEGDFRWEGPAFSWKPASAWDPGVRYRMMVSGSVPTLDGREARPDIDLPFYSVRSAGRPVLTAYSPGDGASVGVPEPGYRVLELRFSEPMDASAVRDALSIRPSFEFAIDWNDDGTIAMIAPGDRLSPCSGYRWTLDASARAVDGSPLARSETASFVTDLDGIPPRVERAYPAVLGDGAWREAAPSLDAVDAGHSIALLFSEDMDAGSVRSGIRIAPVMAGHVEVVSPRLAVFTPDAAWEPEAGLELIVSADAADISGLGLAQEYRAAFTPITSFLRIVEVAASAGESTGDAAMPGALRVTIGAEPDGVLDLTLVFSAPFGPGDKAKAIDHVSLAPFFPRYLAAPRLRSATWFSDDTLAISWEGLVKSSSASTNYYELGVRGGLGGMTGAFGSYLKSDASLRLEAKE